MKNSSLLIMVIFLLSGCIGNSQKTDDVAIKAYNIDFNWGEGGPNGFTKPVSGSMMPPVDYYLSKLIDRLKGDERNIAVLDRVYNNLPFDYVKK